MNTITAEKLKKSFGNKTVLDDIELEIKSGEIVGLIGPSGAGKTTLIRIITGQLTRDSGTAHIFGIDSTELSQEDKAHYGIMMDDFGVYDRLSCFDNLKLFARIYGVGNSRINRVMNEVGLADAAHTPASKLSKGMKNRLRLARAFMTEPDILFLDEPTSGLDPAAADGIHKMILDKKAQGRTVFLTTHSMSEAQKLCDHIAMLCDGHIVEYGTPDDICRRYDSKRSIMVHLTDGTDLVLENSTKGAQRLCDLIKMGQAGSIHTSEPDLAEVFMELTGKELTA